MPNFSSLEFTHYFLHSQTNQPIIVKSAEEKLEKTETQIYNAFIETVDHVAMPSLLNK